MNFLNLSDRKFAIKLNISRRVLRNYINEDLLLPSSKFYNICRFYPIAKKFVFHIMNKLPSNWGQIKGGKIRSKMMCNLTMEERIKGFRKANLNSRKRKVTGPCGERMYNYGEKRVAEFLLSKNFSYVYEPIIRFGNKYTIPDFLVGKTLIERCGYSKWHIYWSNVVRKLKLFNRKYEGKVIILVPSKRFEYAIKRLKNLKNLIIVREEYLDLLEALIS